MEKEKKSETKGKREMSMFLIQMEYKTVQTWKTGPLEPSQNSSGADVHKHKLFDEETNIPPEALHRTVHV